MDEHLQLIAHEIDEINCHYTMCNSKRSDRIQLLRSHSKCHSTLPDILPCFLQYSDFNCAHGQLIPRNTCPT